MHLFLIFKTLCESVTQDKAKQTKHVHFFATYYQVLRAIQVQPK